MIISYSPRFERSYKQMPSRVKIDFKKKIILFGKNPRNARLKTHKLKGRLKECLSFCLCDGYRVLFSRDSKNSAYLIDIGAHDKYNKWVI